MRQSKRVRFPNGRGQQLAGIVEIPNGPVWVWGVFTHCFTCTKDLKAIVKISRRLAEHGIGILRFDCTGLGESEGDFSETNFDTTCQDVRAAAEYTAAELGPPRLLIGHSFGGAASLTCANDVPGLSAVSTIAAPSDTKHLADHIAKQNPEIDRQGSGDFSVGGQTYLVRRQLLQNLREFDLQQKLNEILLPLLIFHSPIDETLAWDHAQALFHQGRGPKSLIALDGADHLLINQPNDVSFVADLLAIWLGRYVPQAAATR